MSEHVSDYLFAGSVRLRIRGSRRVLRHFDAEYGEAAAIPGTCLRDGGQSPTADLQPDVEVRIRPGLLARPGSGGALVVGGHKSARWRVALAPPDAVPLRATIALAGGPPSFALSLVQGYFVEALVAVALARTGRVALPSAAFASGNGGTVLLGRSGAGKTTLTARALAAGRTVLSDDQVIIDGAGGARRYPRRLRFYPDIQQTAPDAWSRLTPGTRAALLRRHTVRRLTRGFVAPSLAVPVSELGTTVAAQAVPVRQLVVVDRSGTGELTVTPRDAAWVVEQAGLVLADQRARLSAQVSGPWAAVLDSALAAERRTVAAAFRNVPAVEVAVPRAWGAQRSIDALDVLLGLTSGRATLPAVGPPARA